MAKKKKTTKKAAGNSKKNLSPLILFFNKQSTRRTLGVILFVLSIVWVLVCCDYLRSGSEDQSLVAGHTISQIADAGEAVENAGGAVGSWWAHAMLVDGFGIASFVLAFYVCFLALALFGVVRCRFWLFTFRCLFTTIALSIIIGLFTYNAETVIYWGGNHGHYINKLLLHYSDVVGAYAVSIILIGLLIVMNSKRLYDAYKQLQEVLAQTEKLKRASELIDKHSVLNQPLVEFDAEGFAIDDDRQPGVESGNYQDQNSDFNPVFNITNPTPEEEAERKEDMEEVNQILQDLHSPESSLSHYIKPTVDLLEDRPVTSSIDVEEQQGNKDMIVRTLADYGIPILQIDATVGPTVTLYEIVPAEGIRIAQIKRLEDDIALSLAALGIRIIAPIPGKGTIGIEVPNHDPQTVSMYSVINSQAYRTCNYKLPLALGSTINNQTFIVDLTKMPHILVAGATGQGKSVGLNCMIASLIFKKHPAELKFVLIDPKMVEFSLYSRLENYFLAKIGTEEEAIVTDPNKALDTLKSLCLEMDNRYELLRKAAVRTVEEYNKKYNSLVLDYEEGHRFLPYIVIIVDEFADLIMTAGKDISTHIARIAQKARAVGMHMIIATQRPSTDVITGMIKANFPARIAFRVSAMVDSKTILDRPGANRLIGRGDMLFSHNSRMERVQCAFIDTPEIENIVNFIDRQAGFPTAYLLPENPSEFINSISVTNLGKRDPLFEDCAREVLRYDSASTSMLQRHFGIGYNKAGKIMDQLESAGIVGAANGVKPRAILVDEEGLERILASMKE